MKTPVAKAMSLALPVGAAALAWASLEALRHVNEALALGAGAVFLTVAVPVLIRGRK